MINRKDRLHPAPDPISSRLTSFAMAHSEEMREARQRTAEIRRIPLESVGLVIKAEGPPHKLELACIFGFTADAVLNIARRTGLEELPGEPGFWPVLIVDPVDTCLAWFGEKNFTAQGAA